MIAKKNSLGCVLFCVLAAASSAFGQSVLTFPRVIADTGVYTGIAVSNPNTQAAPVTFSAFLASGTLASGTGVQNPVTLMVPAGGQIAQQFTEIFGGPASFNGWVQATSTTTGLTGFFLNGNTALTDLDGAGSVSPASDLVLPFTVEDSTVKTEVTIVNVNTDTVNATLTLYGPDGGVITEQNVSLPGLGLVRQTLDSILGAGDFSAASHIKIHSSLPVIASEVVANYLIAGSSVRRETIDISGQVADAGQTYILPQFATGGGWLSLIGLANAGGVAQDVTLTAYKEDGTVWTAPTNPAYVSLPANGGMRATAEQLFGFTDDTESTGWIEVTSSLGFLSAYIGYGNATTPSFAAVSATEVGNASEYQVFSQVAEGAGFYTGLSAVNPGTTAANVDFYIMRPDGTTIGDSSFTLGPSQQIGKLFRELLPAALNQVGGWAFLRSSQPLVAATLFGTTNGDALANVPQQLGAGNFTPSAQNTGAISGSALAGTSPVTGAQVTISGPVNATTTTDGNGQYTFGQLPSGAYSVRASALGAQFAPNVINVTVNQQNVDNTNFQAGGLMAANAPVATLVTPAATFVGNSTFSVDVFGQNFSPTSVVYLNSLSLQTTFVSTAVLQAVVPAGQLTTAQTLSVTVETPPPGGGVSSALGFVVNPLPSNPLIIGQAATGNNPAGVAYDAKRNHVLVTNEASDSVSVIDLNTMTSIAAVAVGRSPADGIAIDTDKDVALVANPGSDDVSVIDLTTNTESTRIPLTGSAAVVFPLGLAIDQGVNRAYVANSTAGTLSIIDLNALSESGHIEGLGQGLSNVAINPTTHIGIVTNVIANTATFFNTTTNQTVGTIATGQRPREVAVNTSTNQAVIVNANSNDAWIIDMAGQAVLAKVAVGTGPTGVAIHELTNSAVVTNSSVSPSTQNQFGTLGSVSIVDLASQDVTNITVGASAFGVDIDAADQTAMVADYGSNDLTVLRIPNPVPRITDSEPKTFLAGGGTFTVTIFGTGFLPTSVVTLNQQSLATTYVSSTELQAQITADILNQQLQRAVQATAGEATPRDTTPIQLNLGVNNPGPGGGSSPPSSNGGNYLIPQNGVPYLTSIAPTSAAVGTTLTLTLNGNNFNGTSVVNVGSLSLSPISSSPTSMTVLIPSGAFTAAGPVAVSVFNPAPGGGTSSAATFTVTGQGNPSPSVTNISPQSIAAGSGATTVTVQGTGFIQSTTASLAGIAGVVSQNSITFAVPASQLTTATRLAGIVTTPGPGGGSVALSVNVLSGIPTINAFAPTSAIAGTASVTLTVNGSNFVSGTQVTVAGTPLPTTLTSSTQLTATMTSGFLLYASTVPIGVSNPSPGGGSVTGNNFTIIAPTPTLASITPAQLALQNTPATITLSGTGFIGNSAVTGIGPGVSVAWTSQGSLIATIPANLLQVGRIFSVQVSNPAPGGGTSGIVQLPVVNPVPTISMVNPSTVSASQNGVVLTVTGTNFVSTSSIVLTPTVSQSGLTAASRRPLEIAFRRDISQTTFVSSTQLTMALVPPYPLGIVDVTVVNPAPGGGTSNVQTIEITPLAPTISKVAPSSVNAGQAIDVTGTSFGPGSLVLLRGSAIPTTVNSTTDLSATIPINATLGSADVVVQNPATSTTAAQNSASFTITIVTPTPVITSLDPTSGAPLDKITIHGQGFVSTSTVTFNGQMIASTSVDSETLSFAIPAGTPSGSAQVAVVNPNGGGTSNTVTLNVIAPPSISSISPNTGTVGESVSLTVFGSNFVQGAVISFNSAVLSTSFSSSAQLSATALLPTAAGAYMVTVTNPNGVVSNPSYFIVNALVVPPPPNPTPTLTAVQPSMGTEGTAVPVTLTGTSFVSGATVALNGTGVLVSNVTVVNPTSITATFTIAGNAPIGSQNVTVTTGAGTSTSVSFTVILPVVSSSEFPVPTPGGSPKWITAGPDGNTWFTEEVGGKIGMVTPAGVISEFSIPTADSSPEAITSGPDGNLWFAELAGNKIAKITTAGVVTEFTASGQPNGITSGPDGNLWFTDKTGKIGRITTAGVFTEYMVPTGSSVPYAITAGPDGNLWFTEFGGNNIGRITTAGGITEFPVPTRDSLPLGIAAGVDGNLWFAESSGNKIARITTAGVITEFTVNTSSSGPSGITPGPDGNLWFTESIANQIGRISPSGVIGEFSIPTSGSDPLGITTGHDGNIWFAEDMGNKIGKLHINAGSVAAVAVETAANGIGTVIPAQNVTAGNSITAYAIERDSSGNFIANVPVAWTLTSVSGSVLAADLVPAVGNKRAVFTGHLTGSANITATANSLNGASGTLGVVTGAAAKLAFTLTPTTAFAGITLSPPPTVVIEDMGGNPVAGAANSITIALGPGSPTATLSGTTTVSATGGVSVFNGLSINNVASGYTLIATSPGLGSATSIAFNVTTPTTSVLADYPFDGNGSDASGNGLAFVTQNVTFLSNALSVSGIYRLKSNGYVAETSNISAFNYSSFAISADFNAATDAASRPIFVGGPSFRWIALQLSQTLELQVSLNNDSLTYGTGQIIRPGQWYNAAVSFDLSADVVRVFLNGQNVLNQALPNGFQLEVIGTPSDPIDKIVTLENDSNGTAYKGLIRNLFVFSNAVTAVPAVFCLNSSVQALSLGPATVTLAGSGFLPGASVISSNTSVVTVSHVAVVNSNTITLTATPQSLGSTTFEVVNPGGSTAASPAFTVASTAMTAVAPSSADLGGGSRVILTGIGANLTSEPVSVQFGDTFGLEAKIISSNQIAVFTPPHAEGILDLTITVGGQAQTLANAFTFTARTVGGSFATGPENDW